MEPVTSEILLMMILVSFIGGTSAIIGGAIILIASHKFAEHLREVHNQRMPGNIFAKAYAAGLFSITYGLFFFFRISHIINTNTDFIHEDWFLLNLTTGIFILIVCSLVKEAFDYKLNLIKQNDQQL